MVAGAFGAWIRSALLPAVRSGDVRVTGPLALGIAGAAFVCVDPPLIFRDKSRWFSSGSSDGQAMISVMTWNVLARPFTSHNREAHRNRAALEHPDQTRSRYTLAGGEILNVSSDLVFLQECEADFFESNWNPFAAKLLEMYDAYPCRSEPSPGTAVLVKKNGRAVAKGDDLVCIGGTKETGGESKIATLLPVRVGSKAIMAVSTHFTWNGAAEKRLHHAGLMTAPLAKQCAIVGGDFNCEPGEHLELLESTSFFGNMKRAELPTNNSMTGLSGDFSQEVCIDHVYVSPDLEVLNARALRNPSNPYAGKHTKPAKISGASDHVPVLVELAWK